MNDSTLVDTEDDQLGSGSGMVAARDQRRWREEELEFLSEVMEMCIWSAVRAVTQRH